TMALTNGGTFFSFWLGNNDVLGYATGGASNPAIYTSTTDFETWFRTGLGALLSVPGTKGVVANIPNVTDIPYFTTINNGLITPAANGCAPGSAPSSALPFSLTAEQAAGLNMQYAAAGINPDFKEGKVNYFLITTPTGVRQMDPAKDLLILTTPTDSLGLGELKNCDCTTKGLRKGWGITKPIATNWVLDEAEVADITKRVEDFNGIIKTVVEEAANNERLALVDINKIFGEVANWTKVVNGINFTASIAPPFGAFSLDGVHPNARGSAFIANQFIDAINTKFGSSIPTVNPNNYPGNDLPQ
ncbi:MAG TPA: hypothetical protein VD908_18205, partial [Cytophagales bacterium]|nr:hypothetical protein [Cytophagales bacterium]